VLPGGICSAIRVAQVRVWAWSQTHTRCSPVSRDITLMIGGRSVAEVPGPLRVLARRRGRSEGSGCGVPLFPRMVLACVGFEGDPHHHSRRGRLVEVGLNPLPSCMALLTERPHSRARRAAGSPLAIAYHAHGKVPLKCLSFGGHRRQGNSVRL
jgi:hypothetical protein